MSMRLAEVGRDEVDAYVRRLEAFDLSQVRESPGGVAGEWVERCELALDLPGSRTAGSSASAGWTRTPWRSPTCCASRRSWRSGALESPVAGGLPADYLPRFGDLLLRVDEIEFEVVGRTADGQGIEVRGKVQPLSMYLTLDELRTQFVRILRRGPASEAKSPGIRISSGELKGRRLEVPAGIRPTEQKVKEALFSIWGERLAGGDLARSFRRQRCGRDRSDQPRRPRSHGGRVEPLGAGGPETERVDPAGGELPPAASTGRAGPDASSTAAPPASTSSSPIRPTRGCRTPASSPAAVRCCVPGERSPSSTAPGSCCRCEAGDLVRTDSRRYGESALTFYGKARR